MDWLTRGRFRKTIPDVIDRIGYLPRMRRQELSLNPCCRTSRFRYTTLFRRPDNPGGSGLWDAGGYLAGEVSPGTGDDRRYQKMGFMACVADSSEAYEDIAIELIQNSEYARDVRAGILETVPALFDVSGSVREHLRIF